MPVFKSNKTLQFGRKGNLRLVFKAEVGLIGFGRILDKLRSRSRTDVAPAKAPPQKDGPVLRTSPQAQSPAHTARRRELASNEGIGTMRFCKVCDISDWEDKEFQATLDELDLSWAKKDRRHRKAWEFAQGIRGLKYLGALKPDALAIGVGAGHELPLYYLANHIKEVHATDIYGSGTFAEGEGSAEMLTNPQKFALFPYREDHLVVKYMDGCNLEYPDNSFDIAFCFSSIEHFGGHEAATRSMQEMARVLRPGGVAVITTEVILNDVPHYEFFLPEELYEYLVEPSGWSWWRR